MNIILLSGGSGKRLWPLSNDIRAKQFIKIFNGQTESMVQRIYRQIREADPDAQIVIATSRAQVSAIHNQLGEQVSISVEPCQKDTFPAIVLAAVYLAEKSGLSPQEPVIVCPVDPFVDDSYFTSLQTLSQQVAKGESNLVLMGIEPAYPSEKYGYIIPEKQGLVSRVSAFKEKPDKGIAQAYMAQGALWNTGVFGFRLGYVLEQAHKRFSFGDYQDLLEQYGMLEKISFDYAAAEQETDIQVLRFAGRWKDLGTWNTLTEAMPEPVVGNGVMDTTCSNVSILNELDVPILAMGLHDIVISASPEGILVSDKEQSSKIKPYVDQFCQQVMFAEKSWGSYRVLEVSDGSLTIKVTLHAGHRMNYHSHKFRDEVWVVATGHGKAVIDGRKQMIQAGDVIVMHAGCRHTVIADDELQLIEVQIGSAISVQDKEKHELES